MIVLIDNYDSFTYNLADYIKQLHYPCRVVKNDEVTVDAIASWAPTCVIISPGPGEPSQSGISLPALAYFTEKLPILGVCLGHQAIAAYFGATIVPALQPTHGKQDEVQHDNTGMFASLPNPMSVVRYHSLVVDEETLPPSLSVSAYTADGTIMGIRHKTLPIEGVQFHPEAILTTQGLALLRQFFITYCPQKERLR